MSEKGTCKSCGAEVVWITMKGSGRPNPLNPVPQRRIVIESRGDEDPVGVVVATYESHFATCPQAKQWRKKG
jgi:hypothetical protein